MATAAEWYNDDDPDCAFQLTEASDSTGGWYYTNDDFELTAEPIDIPFEWE